MLHAEQIKTAAEEMRRQEAKTSLLAKELSSTDANVIDNKIAEIQGKLEAGGLAFKAEKVFLWPFSKEAHGSCDQASADAATLWHGRS